MAVIAQLVARRSHNPKDVSSVRTHRMCKNSCRLSLQLSISYRDHVLLVSFSGYVVNSSTATNYTLWGSSPRPVAHETIALTTELMEHSCSACNILLPRVAQAYACCTSRMKFQSLLSPSTACGIRARNLRIRSPTPCPWGCCSQATRPMPLR